MDFEHSNYHGVQIMFRKLEAIAMRSLWNRLASWRSGSPYIHCEAYFIDDNVTVTTDTRRPVTFIEGGNDYSDRRKWEGILIWMPKSNYDLVYQYCAAQEGKPFDTWGIMCYDFRQCITITSEDQNFICSRLLTKALINGDVIPSSINPTCIRPDQLRNILLEESRFPIENFE
jgi:hypothetical protein